MRGFPQTKDAAVRAALAASVAAGPSSKSTGTQDQTHATSELITLGPFATPPVARLHNFQGGGSGKADGTGSMEGGSVGKLLGSPKAPRSNKNQGSDGQIRGDSSSAYRTQSAPCEPGAGSVLSVAASNSSMNASGRASGSLRRRHPGSRRGSVLHSMRLSFVDIGTKVLGEEFKERQRISDLRRDFVEEMRTLSKLRHPCITTVQYSLRLALNPPFSVFDGIKALRILL